MGKALTDIGNGGLESTPIARRTNPEHLSASAAAVAGKPDCLRTSVKPGRNKTMAPQPPVALRANCHLGPLAKLAQLEQTLDGKVQEQYQGSVLGEFYSPCLGVKGGPALFTPISSSLASSPHSVDIICPTRAFSQDIVNKTTAIPSAHPARQHLGERSGESKFRKLPLELTA